jgi:hypothetical protein
MYICYINFKNPKPKKPLNTDIAFKMLSIIIPALLYSTTVCMAAPSTGMAKLDAGGWKIVGVLQGVVFWVAMAFTIKSLLEVTIKGEGSWKKVGQGFMLCAMDYLVPWGFTIIRDAFR